MIDYLEITMQATLGKDWESYFDIILTSARKPLFMKAESPFYEINKANDNYKGKVLPND